MSVYIKGMTMPNTCNDCPLCRADNAYRCEITHESYSWGIHGRPSECPLYFVESIPVEWIESQVDKGKWRELVQRWREQRHK